jgi:transposase-like protein
MAHEVNQVLLTQWRQRLESQSVSGLSIVAFCRKEGVSQATFHAWKRKLRDPLSARPESRKVVTARCSPRRRAAAPKHSRDFLQIPVTAARSSPWIELTLADGTLVRVPQQNTAALVSVLRILRGEPLDRLDVESRHA